MTPAVALQGPVSSADSTMLQADHFAFEQKPSQWIQPPVAGVFSASLSVRTLRVSGMYVVVEADAELEAARREVVILQAVAVAGFFAFEDSLPENNGLSA